MPNGSEYKDKDHIEEAKKSLYSRTQEPRKRKEGILRQVSYGIPGTWAKEAYQGVKGKVKLPPSFMKKFFIFSVFFFCAALAFTFLKFYRGANTISAENISISILGNSFAAGGEELPLQIQITNANNLPLELADLLIEYPKGSGEASPGELVRLRKSLGEIRAGETLNENAKVVLFGEQGTMRDIKVSLEYRVQSSNAIFVKEAVHQVNISQAPIEIAVSSPPSVTSGQEITLNVRITGSSSRPVSGILLQAEYPPGWQFSSSSPSTISGNNVWDLGDLAQGTVKNISIKGVLFGQDREEKSFRFYVGERDAHDVSKLAVKYNSILETLSITRPFIEARLLVNGQDQSEYAIGSQSSARGQINWVNNLPTKVNDVVIRARLSGSILDRASVSALSGFYDSSSGAIVWDRNTLSTLASVEPGEKGTVDFSFASLPLYFDSGAPAGSPVITVEVSISARQPAEGNILTEINNFETKTVKINSDFQLSGRALYYEGPFQNTGPIPPKAEARTTYTILWSVTNSSNAVASAEARAILPFYVRFAGPVSPSGENLTYNDITREVLWRIGTVAPGTGISSAGKEVAFQVELVPSLSQIGSVPQLVGETVLSGTDSFTGAALRYVRQALNTRLSNDAQFRSGDEVVVP